MKLLIGALIAVVASAVLIVALTKSKSNITTTDAIEVYMPGQGRVLGSIDETLWTQLKFYSFRGLPYAEPPKGKLRFKLPKSRVPWNGTCDARYFGKRCPVITTVSQLNASELKEDLEDCLNLSVYTKCLNTKKPVMFYIYGGGFVNGSAPDFPPHFLLEKDIVLVVAQYRVGALGWLTTFTDEMPGNAPVMDLMLALDWVQKYIHLFGGDPNQVTIDGQSPGTVMSGALLLSPKRSQKYFKRSIVRSGNILSPFAINRTPLQQVERICRALGCAGCGDKQRQFECLQQVDVLELLKVTTEESFGAVVGDVHGILPDEPRTLLENLNRMVPLMLGFTKHDGSFVLATLYDSIVAQNGSISKLTVRQFASQIIAMGKDNTGLSHNLLLRRFFQPDILDTNNHTGAWPAYIDIISIIFVKSSLITLANTVQRRPGSPPIHFYTFDYVGENTRFGYERGNSHYPFEGGVHHGNDNIYLFPTRKLNAKDTKFAKKMVDLWSSYVIDGVPKVEDQPELIIKSMETECGPYFHINDEVTLDNNFLKEFTVAVDDPEGYKLVRPKK